MNLEPLKKVYRRIRLFYKIFLKRDYNNVDLWFWKKGDETLRLNYPLNQESLVLDIGGYKGEWAFNIYSLYQPLIYIFEPVSSFQNIIHRKFENNSKIKLFKFGLGNESRFVDISLDADGSSTHRRLESRQVERIEIVGIDQFFKNNQIEQVDLMKINIEGEEYVLLQAMLNNNLHKKVKNIQVQFHSWIDNATAMRSEIQKSLSKTHRLTYDFPFVWENWERIDE